MSLKPTLEALLGMSNEDLLKLTDPEIDEYLAEALSVKLQGVEVKQATPGRTIIHTGAGASRGKSSARPGKHRGPSELAQELAQQAIDSQIDAEVAAMEAEILAAAIAKKKGIKT